MSILAQHPTDSNALVAQYGTDTIELPMMWIDGRSSHTPTVGERYSMVLEQRPTNPRCPDQLRAAPIDPDSPGHLGANPQVGYQWGWEPNEPVELVFTVVGTYVIESVVPDFADLSFTFLFRRETQAVSA